MRIIRQLASPARVAVVVLAALACFSSVARSAAESEEQIRRWSQSVVQVQARQCAAGPAQAGTGFLWQKPEWVVTSLHVVNGCQQISVYSESAGVTRPAHLDHVLRAADLAVLRMDNPPRLPLLPAAPARPSVNEDLLTLGYELNIPKLSSTSLRVRYGGKHLEDIVPPAVRSDLARAGSPDVGIDIVFLEGHLLHGLSGAPILDSSGRLTAVADGGLENGAASISWGIPLDYLSELQSSREPLGGSGARHSAALFAADLEASAGPQVNCGGVALRKVRTRTFQQLSHSTDDPRGLQQIENWAGIDLAPFSFDIYEHPESGATVAVPAGAELESAGNLCVASLDGGRFQIKIQLLSMRSPAEGQSESTRYEDTVIESPNRFWQVDPRASYWFPYTRFDGLTVRRKSAIKFAYRGPYLVTDRYLFETLAARGNIFVGAAAVDYQYSPETVQGRQMCGYNRFSPLCQPVLAAYRQWIQCVLAVHLTTFPIG